MNSIDFEPYCRSARWNIYVHLCGGYNIPCLETNQHILHTNVMKYLSSMGWVVVMIMSIDFIKPKVENQGSAIERNNTLCIYISLFSILKTPCTSLSLSKLSLWLYYLM